MARKKLKDLTINKVALVPAGANPGAHVLLYKGEEGEPTPEDIFKATFNEIRSARVASQVAYRVCDMAYDFIEAAYSAPKDSSPKASLEKSLAQFADAVTTILAEAKDMKDTDAAVAASKSATDDRAREHRVAEEEPVKKKETIKKALADMTHEELLAHAEALEKSASPEPEPEPEVPAAVQKMLNEQAEEIRKANERAAKAEADAKVEKEARERGQMANFAKSKVPNIPGTDQEKGNVLYEVEKAVSKETYEAFLKMLEAGDAAIAKAMETEGFDEDGNEGDTAVEKLDTIAKQMVKDGKAKTYEQAFAKATDENPDLYRQYRSERRQDQHAH